MKYITAILSFLVVFMLVFVLGGLFFNAASSLTPDRPITALENEFWMRNWAGAVLGLILGGLSAHACLKGKVDGKSFEVVD